jgi:hypothetical protein
LFLLVCAASPLACLGANASEDRQLDAMRKEISEVQSDGDKFEERLDRAGGDSNSRATPSKDVDSLPAPAARSESTPMATPELPIVHLRPDGAENATERPAADDGKQAQVLSFTNANIGSAIAAHPGSPGLRVSARRDQDGGTR